MRNGKNFNGNVVAKVYTLSDRLGNIFYVGVTINSLEKRLGAHISEARSGTAWDIRRKKNKKIIALNFDIVASVIDMQVVEADEHLSAIRKVKEIEKSWILKYIQLGYDLCNKEAGYLKAKTVDYAEDFVGLTITVKSGVIENISSKVEIIPNA